MEPISVLLTSAISYILKGAAESKVGSTAKEEILGRFWKWAKPFFIKEIPSIEEKTVDEKTEQKVQQVLIDLIKNEDFFKELNFRVSELRKIGIKGKNIVKGNIENVKKVTIGDKVFSVSEVFDQKNIVGGNVSNVDEFRLGDG